MLEVLIGNDEQLKTFSFGTIEQVAVADASPAQLDGSRYFMTAQRVVNLNGNRFVENESSRDEFVLDPLLTKAENACRLFSIHGGKRFQKIFQRKAIGQIIEQRPNRNARTLEDRRAVKDRRVACNKRFRCHLILGDKI